MVMEVQVRPADTSRKHADQGGIFLSGCRDLAHIDLARTLMNGSQHSHS